MNKKDLRIKYKAIRNSIEKINVLSDRIFSQLISSDAYKAAHTVLGYWSVDSEVVTHRIISKALTDGKKVALPKCLDKNGNMEFYYISSPEDLSEGMYGIMEPRSSSKADDLSESDVCLVPGLSFDSEGYRLGYGKGYYDRFLSTFKGISIGLCYEVCLSEGLPMDEHDKRVNYIITDKKIYFLR